MKLGFGTVIDLPLSDTIRVPAHESPAVVEAIRVTSEVRIRVAQAEIAQSFAQKDGAP